MKSSDKFVEVQKSYWEQAAPASRRSAAHPVIQEYAVSKIAKVQETIDISKATSLLDVGCGNGFFTYYFDQICDTTGIDFSEKMVSLNPVKNVHIMRAEAMEYEDNTFDIVFCHALLHHVEDTEKVVSEMRRVSRKWIVILEPNRNNPLMFMFSAIKKEERKALRFSLDYLRQLACKGRLDIKKAFSYGMLVPNRTPELLLPILRVFNRSFPLGMTNFLIAKKIK